MNHYYDAGLVSNPQLIAVINREVMLSMDSQMYFIREGGSQNWGCPSKFRRNLSRTVTAHTLFTHPLLGAHIPVIIGSSHLALAIVNRC